MAKQMIHRIGNMQAAHLLLTFSLGLAIAAAPVLAGQQSSSNSKAKNAQTSGQKSASSSTASSPSSSSSSGSSLGAGKRDPFKIPDYETGGGGHGGDSEMINGGANLPPGERGLVISQLVLEGIVREIPENKMIAVVTNDTKRAYFLHENQSVYNGVVSKITMDSVYFTENVLDAEGRVTTREVVKRINAASGEGR